MTVSVQDNIIRYTGNAEDKIFPVEFPVLAATDLSVWLTDRESNTDTLQVITTHYTVNISDDNQSATVTFVAAPTTANYVTIARVLPITPVTNYVENDTFPAETHEAAIDKLTMICQQLQKQLARASTLSITSTDSPPAISAGSGIAGVTNVFPVKITSTPTSGVSTFVEQEPAASGAWEVKSGGLTGSSREINGCLESFLDDYVMMIAIEDSASSVEYRFSPPGVCP